MGVIETQWAVWPFVSDLQQQPGIFLKYVGTGARNPGTDPDETELILVPALGAKSKREAQRAPKGLPAPLELAEVTSADKF